MRRAVSRFPPGAACHLRRECPQKSFAILEGRASLGGTWDLFRYPGVRSDSDMYTLGYSFRPWSEAKAIADGPSILNYIRETAREFGIDKKIRYGHRVRRASWSSEAAKWTVEAETDKAVVSLTCNFLFLCTGYYDYESGYTPEWQGVERFRGRVVHPQKWPEDLDYAGKRVVVIGSGATAVTLVPALAERAAHVTMLQRSPSYVASIPAEDRIANWLRTRLPPRIAYALARWKNVLVAMFFYTLARSRLRVMKRMIAKGVRRQLGADYDLRHFTPRYNPWDQRLCLVPNADLFRAIRAGRASVVTDQIDGFTETGLLLRLARRRCNLAIADVNESGLSETAQLLRASGVRVSLHRLDVADRAAVAGFPAQVSAEHERLDVLVNNAGVAGGGTFEQLSDEDFEWLFEINFWGVVRMTRAFLPLLRASDDAPSRDIAARFSLSPSARPARAAVFVVAQARVYSGAQLQEPAQEPEKV